MSNTLMRRGKRLDNGQWIQGASLLTTTEGSFMAGDGFNFNARVVDGNIVDLSFSSGCFAAVDVDTIGGCMEVKDKNGQFIFEGDIVKGFNTFHDREETYVVRHTVVGLMLCECGNEWHPEHIEQMEVIGNLWDNPELCTEEGRY